MSDTPLRSSKPTVRRKLVSPKVANTKIKPICPVAKRPRIQVGNIDENAVDNTVPLQKTSAECTPSKLLNDDEDFLSQEVCSQMGRGLPRIIWQSQQINSPLLSDSDDTRDNDTFSNLKIDSPKQKPTYTSSTPYLKKIWNGSRARFQSIASAESSSSKAPIEKDLQGSWMNEMYGRVALLEASNSRSPTPDKQSPTCISSQSSQFTKVSTKGGIVTPEQSVNRFGNNTQSTRSSGCTMIRPPTPLTGLPGLPAQSYTKPDNNSSLFSDSLDEFNGDFTLSDSDDGSSTSQAKPPETSSRPFEHLSGDKLKNSSSNTRTVGAGTITEIVGSGTITEIIGSGANAEIIGSGANADPLGHNTKEVKSELKTPFVKAATSLSIKLEPKTPPNKIINRGAGSPRTPLRRYNSDGVIRSPRAEAHTETQNPVPAPAAASLTDKTTSTESVTLNLIEEKRKQAMSKLKSRKGSFVKHKSLDSATIAARHIQANVLTQAIDSDRSEESLKLLIEEKRRLAAEKLQKHREVTKDKCERLSGTLRQLTPPSSQEIGGVSIPSTASTEPNNMQNPGSKSLSQPSDLEKKGIKFYTEGKAIKKEVRSSQTNVSSQRCVFSGKLALDEIMDDLEFNSPIKPKPPPQRNKEKTTPSNNQVIPKSLGHKQQISTTAQNKQSMDERTRLIIEQKRKAALEKLKQSKKP